MSFYVYQYLTENGTPYYIGKGSVRRIHIKHLNVEPGQEPIGFVPGRKLYG